MDFAEVAPVWILPLALALVPAFLASRGHVAGAAMVFVAAAILAVVQLTFQWRAVIRECIPGNESGCGGTTASFYFLLAWFGAFAGVGALLSVRNFYKWRKARLGAE